MDTTIRYVALVLFLLTILAIAYALSDGIPIGRGRGGGPITEGFIEKPMV